MIQAIAALLRWAPGVTRAVGRRRFATFVGPRVPAHVSGFRARFDLNLTLFTFEPPFDRDDLLAAFEQQETAVAWKYHRLVIGTSIGDPTRQFHRVMRDRGFKTVWLYLNDDEGKGAVLAL